MGIEIIGRVLRFFVKILRVFFIFSLDFFFVFLAEVDLLLFFELFVFVRYGV